MNSRTNLVARVAALATTILLLPISVNAEEMHHDQTHAGQHHSTMMPSAKSEDETMPQNMQPSPGHEGDSMHHMQGSSDHHSDHGMAPAMPSLHSSISLEVLTQLPPSGKAREAGYDGRYSMEYTSVDH